MTGVVGVLIKISYRTRTYWKVRPKKVKVLYGSVTLYGPTFQTVPVHLLHLFDYSYNPDDAVTTSV